MKLRAWLKKVYRGTLKRLRRILKVGAFGIILDERQRVLLCHRRDVDLWNLPGGGVEIGEMPWQTVVREVKEEVGLDVVVRRLAGIYIHPTRSNIAFSFVCEIVGGKPETSDEADAIKYFAFERIPSYTYPYHVARIKDVLSQPRTLHLKLEHGPSAKKMFKQGKFR